jgi:hypothetical protein
MQPYTFYWLSGKKETLIGESPANALNKAGYGSGALRALDFYESGFGSEWVWDSVNKLWINADIL